MSRRAVRILVLVVIVWGGLSVLGLGVRTWRSVFEARRARAFEALVADLRSGAIGEGALTATVLARVGESLGKPIVVSPDGQDEYYLHLLKTGDSEAGSLTLVSHNGTLFAARFFAWHSDEREDFFCNEELQAAYEQELHDAEERGELDH